MIRALVVGAGALAVAAPAAAAPATVGVPADSTELVTGVTDDWSSTTATLQLWTRASGSAAWEKSGEPWTAVVGGAGIGWGRGLHGDGAPAKRQGPAKREGDRRSPAGLFELRGVYGYAAAPPTGTTMPYVALDDQTECVDDPKSPHYTSILERPTPPSGGAAGEPDWHSAEHMRRVDALYTWVIDIAHNPSRVAGGGSCIFFHVWRDASSPTVGCTAMPEPRLAQLIAQLSPPAHPIYALLPRGEYRALATAWGLPPLDGSATVKP